MEFSTSRVGEEDKRSGNSRELVEDDYVTTNFGNYFSEERDQRASANTEIAFKTLPCAIYSGMRGLGLRLRAYYSARGTWHEARGLRRAKPSNPARIPRTRGHVRPHYLSLINADLSNASHADVSDIRWVRIC